jgi:hypothetical protein
MTTQPTEDEIYQKARKRVEEKKGFYAHLCVYLAFNILIVVIWLVIPHSPDAFPWYIFVVGPWSVVIILHCLFVFVFHKDALWEKTAVEREAAKIRKKGQGNNR